MIALESATCMCHRECLNSHKPRLVHLPVETFARIPIISFQNSAPGLPVHDGLSDDLRIGIQVSKEGAVTLRSMFINGLSMALISTCAASAQTAAKAPPPQQTASAPKSPSARVGLFVYPQKKQTAKQQATDEDACYSSAQKQTGIDPMAPPPPPPQVQQQKGGAIKGSARGAAGGAAIGAIAGDAGMGAAIGATAGAVRGRRQQKKANKQAEQQAQQQGQAMQQGQLDTFRRAFSACIDSKGYSVK